MLDDVVFTNDEIGSSAHSENTHISDSSIDANTSEQHQRDRNKIKEENSYVSCLLIDSCCLCIMPINLVFCSSCVSPFLYSNSVVFCYWVVS